MGPLNDSHDSRALKLTCFNVGHHFFWFCGTVTVTALETCPADYAVEGT